jgi:hypothetical protein
MVFEWFSARAKVQRGQRVFGATAGGQQCEVPAEDIVVQPDLGDMLGLVVVGIAGIVFITAFASMAAIKSLKHGDVN